MPSLTDVRDAAVALLCAGMPEAERVEAFAGDLDMQSAAPKNVRPGGGGTIFVAAVEAENAATPDSLDFDMAGLYGVFALARHAAKPEIAEAQALHLAQRAATLLHGATYGLAGVSPARVLSLAPVNGDDLAKAGIWVWSVVWRQTVVFETATPGEVTP